MIATRLPIPMARPIPLGSLRPPTHQWSLQTETDNDPHANIYTAIDTPWQPFHLSLSPTAPKSKSSLACKLLADLDDLAWGTTAMGHPHRVWPARPKFGVIADHRERIGAEVGWPPRRRLPRRASPSYGSEDNVHGGPGLYACDENKAPPSQSPSHVTAPVPKVPPGPARTVFEVKAYAATLPEAIATPLSAVFQDQVDFDFDSGFFECEGEGEEADENKAPAPCSVLRGYNNVDKDREDENENGNRPLEIPEPHLRGTRKPLGVLHFDEAASPPSAVHANADSEEAANSPPVSLSLSPVSSETGSEASTGEGGAKGWARLRAIAPPAIKTGRLEVRVLDKGKEKEKNVAAGVGVGAREVVVGPVTSGSPASEKVKDGKGAGLPVTPRRAALLRILNAQ